MLSIHTYMYHDVERRCGGAGGELGNRKLEGSRIGGEMDGWMDCLGAKGNVRRYMCQEMREEGLNGMEYMTLTCVSFSRSIARALFLSHRLAGSKNQGFSPTIWTQGASRWDKPRPFLPKNSLVSSLLLFSSPLFSLGFDFAISVQADGVVRIE